MPELSASEVQLLKRALLRKGHELAVILADLLAGKEPVSLQALITGGKPGETPIERTRRWLALVDGRIKAIAAGTYGRCDTCAAPLPFVELEQLPWAEACRSHPPAE